MKDSRGLGITIAGYVEQTSPGLFGNVFLACIILFMVIIHVHFIYLLDTLRLL